MIIKNIPTRKQLKMSDTEILWPWLWVAQRRKQASAVFKDCNHILVFTLVKNWMNITLHDPPKSQVENLFKLFWVGSAHRYLAKAKGEASPEKWIFNPGVKELLQIKF